MVEEWIERLERTSRRQRLGAAGVILVLFVVLGVGMNTIASGILKGRPAGQVAKKPTPTRSASGATANTSNLQDISQADFVYLIPKNSSAWTVASDGRVFDSQKDLVEYNVKLTNAGTNVTVTEQPLPSALQPRGSAAFDTFIESNKPSASTGVGDGTLYFLPALENGVTASGADTVIYVTDSVLMFAKAERVVGTDGWTQLIKAMQLP